MLWFFLGKFGWWPSIWAPHHRWTQIIHSFRSCCACISWKSATSGCLTRTNSPRCWDRPMFLLFSSLFSSMPTSTLLSALGRTSSCRRETDRAKIGSKFVEMWKDRFWRWVTHWSWDWSRGRSHWCVFSKCSGQAFPVTSDIGCDLLPQCIWELFRNCRWLCCGSSWIDRLIWFTCLLGIRKFPWDRTFWSRERWRSPKTPGKHIWEQVKFEALWGMSLETAQILSKVDKVLYFHQLRAPSSLCLASCWCHLLRPVSKVRAWWHVLGRYLVGSAGIVCEIFKTLVLICLVFSSTTQPQRFCRIYPS